MLTILPTGRVILDDQTIGGLHYNPEFDDWTYQSMDNNYIFSDDSQDAVIAWLLAQLMLPRA